MSIKAHISWVLPSLKVQSVSLKVQSVSLNVQSVSLQLQNVSLKAQSVSSKARMSACKKADAQSASFKAIVRKEMRRVCL